LIKSPPYMIRNQESATIFNIPKDDKKSCTKNFQLQHICSKTLSLHIENHIITKYNNHYAKDVTACNLSYFL
jgi:hypothetical protein